MIGMLWFDNSKAKLSDKIQTAIDYYEKKYGRRPNVVAIHPDTIKETDPVSLDAIKIKVSRTVPATYFLVGVE